MTKKELATILAYLAAGSGSGKEVSEETAAVYFDVLGALPYDRVREAARKALRQSDWPSIPPVGVLFRLATAGVVARDEDRPGAAYDAACRAVRRLGAYSRVVFDDPIITATIRSIGGWSKFCYWTTDEVQWRKKEFEATYAGFLQTGIDASNAAPLQGERLDNQPVVGIRTGLPKLPDGLVRGRLTAESAVPAATEKSRSEIKRITAQAAASMKGVE